MQRIANIFIKTFASIQTLAYICDRQNNEQHTNMVANMTLAELANNLGEQYTSVRMRAVRKFPKQSWAKHTELTEEQIQAVSIGRSPKGSRTKTKTTTLTPKNKRRKLTLPKFTITDFLGLVVYGHSFLLLYDVSILFAVPGFIAGLLVFGVKHAAVIFSKDSNYMHLAGSALGVCFILDGLAWYAHWTVFKMSTNTTIDSVEAAWICGILAAVVSGSAWFCLYLIKNKTEWQ